MADQQPTASIPGRSQEGDYIYIVQFGSGTIKVGKTKNPTSRLRTHAATARTHGIKVAAQWISQPITTAAENERLLIRFCNERFTSLNGGEYFAGAVIDEVLAFAERLSGDANKGVRMTQTSVTEHRPRPVRMTQTIVPKRRPGRPSIGGPTFSVAFPRDLLDRVDAAAKEAGLTRAAWLRKIAEEAVG